jgi:CheY-like chemotaxis protein
MRKYIVLVEDDDMQATWVRERLSDEPWLNDPRWLWIETEYEFRQKLPGLGADPPDLIIMDVMLNWAVATPDMADPPDDVNEGGYVRAGLRCERMLAEFPPTRNIPVILFTILEHHNLKDELPDRDIYFVSKDSTLAALKSEVRKRLNLD